MVDAVRAIKLINDFIRRQQIMLSVLQHKLNEDSHAVMGQDVSGDGEGDRAPVEGSDQSGAVIVDARNRVTSVGFNGLPHTCDAFAERDILAGDDADVDRLDAVVHAEQNAILFARGDLVGQTLYCTHHPCVRCASIICQSGIVRVVYGDGSLKSDHKTDAAKRLFYHCGVRLENGV